MNYQSKKIIGMFARYFFILLLGAGNLYIFYKILMPTTLFLVSKTVGLFTNVFIIDNVIKMANFNIEIVPACVAGSAFFLLFLLIFSTNDISPKKRMLALIVSSAILLFLNYSRIVFLIAIANSFYFNVIHWILWHLVSIVFVVAIWFFVTKLFGINSVPIYSDIKFLLNIRNEFKEKKK
ncbi:MAG: pacearchaeosortase [Candidatus Pacearchaeota archaeon]